MNKFNQTGNGYYFSVHKPDIGGQMEVSGYPDHTPPIFIDKLMSNNTNIVPNQSGGNPYRKIFNPKSGRMVNLQGKLGEKILQSYISILQNGGADISTLNGESSIFDPNMINREFGAQQPEWNPNFL